jgi:hypothetical protein
MADPATDPDDYELHQVEREELHEEWVWVRKESLRKDIEGSRAALLFEFNDSGKRVCCETLYADDTYLSNRRNPILVGKVVDFDKETRNFKIQSRDRCKPISVVVTKGTKYCNGVTEHSLRNNIPVCVQYSKKTKENCEDVDENCERMDDGCEGADKMKNEIIAKRITGGNELVFMNAWYRCQLGIEEGKVNKRIFLRIEARPYSLCQAMWWQLRACARHPQIAVVMSTVLAVVGTGLGIVGFAALLKELLRSTSGFDWVWISIAILGFFVFLGGFRPLYLRAKLSLPDAN